AEHRRQLRQKGIEPLDERSHVLETFSPERAELENQQSGLLPVRQKRADEHLFEDVRVEEALILASGDRSGSRLRRKHFAGCLLRHLERELEPLGHVREELRPEVHRRELIEGEIAADRRESLRVLAQALLLEDALGELPAREISFARVDLSEPPFVLPR